MVQRYRIDNDISSGRNVSVFEYSSEDGTFSYEIDHSQGQHAERIIGGKLESQGVSGDRVTKIYSELEPCNIPGGKCKGYIAQNFPNADVTYSFEYGDSELSRRKGVKELKKAVNGLCG
jgi:hypothetical protein